MLEKHLREGGLGKKADDDRNDGDQDGDVLKEDGQTLPPSTQQAGHQAAASCPPPPGHLGKRVGPNAGPRPPGTVARVML